MLRYNGSVMRDGVTRQQGAAPKGTPGRVELPWTRTGSCDVEALLIWAVGPQRIGRHQATQGLMQVEAEAMGLEWRGSSSDGCAAIERIGGLGCRIDVSRSAGGVRVHPVAEAVAEVLEAMPVGGLLFDYARVAGRPEGWRPPQRWIRPEAWVEQDEDAMWVYEGRRNGPRLCPVIIACSEEAIMAGREQYQRWWEGLQDAAWLLGLRALGFAVTGPACSPAPWEAHKRS
jgi:hypothetical protein